ncbi:hypothetical protein GCM10028792_33080 [Salinisphaera aquimarina]
MISVDASVFNQDASLITFSEVPDQTGNPVFIPGPNAGGSRPTVSTGGLFSGQAVDFNCAGCVTGSPSDGLSLVGNAQPVFTTLVPGSADEAILSGSPRFNGPISILFSIGVNAAGFIGSFFDAPGSHVLTAFDRQGNLLGSVENGLTGAQFLGLADDSGANSIAGIQFGRAGDNSAGFALDDLRFGQAGQISLPTSEVSVAEPRGLAWLALAIIAGMGCLRRRKSAGPGISPAAL